VTIDNFLKFQFCYNIGIIFFVSYHKNNYSSLSSHLKLESTHLKNSSLKNMIKPQKCHKQYFPTSQSHDNFIFMLFLIYVKKSPLNPYPGLVISSKHNKHRTKSLLRLDSHMSKRQKPFICKVMRFIP
jgi:hypothetical protein